MENQKYTKKGEIYYYDFGNNTGSVQNGRRPVLIIQGDDFNKHSPTTIVAPITSAIKKTYLPSHIYLGEDFGLSEPSMVLVEQIRTVNQCDLEDYVGKIDNDISKLIWQAIKKTTGMWDYTKNNSSSIYTLCPRCLSEFKYYGNKIVSRLDPFQTEKDSCCYCHTGFGYDYVVTEKRRKRQ